MEVIPLDAVVDRIFALTKENGMEQKKLAEILGITDKKVSAWKTGRSKTYRDQIEKIAEVLGTTTEYLLTGIGPKYKTAPADVSNSDTQNEGQLMAAFFEGGKDLSEEEMAVLWQDAKDYIQWKLSQRRKAKDDQ